nr:putative ribonuclease H-like domain-containing protein [Tanacetum cinerariifolium]
LTDFKEHDRGYVPLGEELKVICDKKNSVPFTDTECFVLFTWVFFLATKDETCSILKSFITEIENLVEKKVKIIRCDNGKEFKNKVMNEFCEEKGIKREYSMARTPQQNRVAERKNKTLIEATRTMLADSKLPTTFWAETSWESLMENWTKASLLAALHLVKLLDNTTLGLERLRKICILISWSKPMIAGGGPEWLFDIDALSKSTGTNSFAGKGASFNAGTNSAPVPPGAEADYNNLELVILVSLIPSTRIHKDHPKELKELGKCIN